MSEHNEGYEFQVTMTKRRAETHHRVTLREADYEGLAGCKASPEALVTESSPFPLEYEPMESIIRSCILTAIRHCVSESRHEILGRLSQKDKR